MVSVCSYIEFARFNNDRSKFVVYICDTEIICGFGIMEVLNLFTIKIVLVRRFVRNIKKNIILFYKNSKTNSILLEIGSGTHIDGLYSLDSYLVNKEILEI